MPHNDLGYGHLAVCGSKTDAQRQSELKISEANAGVKPPNCTSASLCP